MRIAPPHAGHRRRSGRKTRSRSGVLDWRLAIAPLQLDCKPNRPSLPDSKLCRRSFFERVLRVRAGDPGLGPPPTDPQPLERVPDGLITDRLGRDAVLGADRGGQGQGPSGAGLAELARALGQERLQPFTTLSIEELGSRVWTARLQ